MHWLKQKCHVITRLMSNAFSSLPYNENYRRILDFSIKKNVMTVPRFTRRQGRFSYTYQHTRRKRKPKPKNSVQTEKAVMTGSQGAPAHLRNLSQSGNWGWGGEGPHQLPRKHTLTRSHNAVSQDRCGFQTLTTNCEALGGGTPNRSPFVYLSAM